MGTKRDSLNRKAQRALLKDQIVELVGSGPLTLINIAHRLNVAYVQVAHVLRESKAYLTLTTTPARNGDTIKVVSLNADLARHRVA